MFIQSNVDSMQAHLSMMRVESDFNKSLAKISSGMELPKPMFGPGMYAVANDMEAIYQEYVQGAKNVQDSQGLLEVAQLAMMEVNDLLLQMNELALRASTDTMNTDQRAELDVEFQRLELDIANVLSDVRFNEISVWGGGGAARQFSIVFGENRYFVISTMNMTAAAFGYVGDVLSGVTNAPAMNAMAGMQSAVNYMSQQLGIIGSQIQEVEGKVDILNEQAVQQKAMEARINELDFAQEMKNFMSMQVVLQASNAMVAQANMKAQMVLQLFGG